MEGATVAAQERDQPISQWELWLLLVKVAFWRQIANDISLKQACLIHSLPLEEKQARDESAEKNKSSGYYQFFESEKAGLVNWEFAGEKWITVMNTKQSLSPSSHMRCMPEKLWVMRTAVCGVPYTAWELFPDRRYDQKL